MQTTVTITEPGRAPLHVVVRRPLEVGRDCDGLLLGDPQLSRRHLRLSAVGGRLSVQDLGSTNGTSIGGSVLVGTVVLQPGDVVEFGRCRLELDDATERVADSGGDPLRRTSIDIVAAAATADPLPSTLTSGGTLTIVFSDIKQSTRRAVALGDERWLFARPTDHARRRCSHRRRTLHAKKMTHRAVRKWREGPAAATGAQSTERVRDDALEAGGTRAWRGVRRTTRFPYPLSSRELASEVPVAGTYLLTIAGWDRSRRGTACAQCVRRATRSTARRTSRVTTPTTLAVRRPPPSSTGSSRTREDPSDGPAAS